MRGYDSAVPLCGVEIVFPVETLVGLDGNALFRNGYTAGFQPATSKSGKSTSGHSVVSSMGLWKLCSRFFGGLHAGRDLSDDINDRQNCPHGRDRGL